MPRMGETSQPTHINVYAVMGLRQYHHHHIMTVVVRHDGHRQPQHTIAPLKGVQEGAPSCHMCYAARKLIDRHKTQPPVSTEGLCNCCTPKI